MKHTIPLSSQALRVVKRMAEGGSLESRRTFPFPHKYILGKPDGTKYAGAIAIDTVATLVEHKLIEGARKDPMGDFVWYTLTQRGAAVAESGVLAYDDQHAELFA